MNKVAIVVPTYPPHFEYVKTLLWSYTKYKINNSSDIYCIFTNESEAEQFGEFDNKIILPGELRIFKNRGIINIKKFYSINLLKNKYEYLLVMDSESQFIKHVDLLKIANSFFEDKILLGNIPKEDSTPIIEGARKYYLNDPNIDKLETTLYLWFNSPCFYKTNNLDLFFEKTKVLENIKNLCWYDFDYYIYMFFLILFCNFNVKDLKVKSFFGALEGIANEFEPYSDCYKNEKIYLCNPSLYHLLPKKNLFLFIQKGLGNIDLPRTKVNNFLRRILSCFIPNKKLRRKIRGGM